MRGQLDLYWAVIKRHALTLHTKAKPHVAAWVAATKRRSPLVLALAKALFLRYWQPAAVQLGALLAIAGVSITTDRLTAWVAPQLGSAPAATLAGVLLCAAALRWARMTKENA